MAKVKNDISVKEAKILLESFLKDEKNIKISWEDMRHVWDQSNTVQLIVNKLSIRFLEKIKTIPLVKDVEFFPKLGGGEKAINLSFKVHIIFEEL